MPEFPDLLYPLSFMRLVRKLPRLSYKELSKHEIPEPYNSLLVHQGDMTSRLEAFHESLLVVSALSISNDGKSYFREVLLRTDEEQKTVEYGAIQINLLNLPEEVGNIVIQAKQPLGGILNEHKIPYVSSPRAFLQITPDKIIAKALNVTEKSGLYGRSNQITDYKGDNIATIVEILPNL